MIKRVKRGEVGEKSVIMRWKRAEGREEAGGGWGGWGGGVQSVFVKDGRR